MLQMIFHQVTRNTAQRFLHAGNLHDYIRTVAVFLHHLLQSPDLAFNAPQAVAVAFLDLWVHGRSLASAGVTIASRATFVLRLATGNGRHAVYPLGLYIPLRPILSSGR